MHVTVSPEAKKFIDAEVQRGHYSSPSELVEHAIEALRGQDASDERRLADLRELIAVARAEADGGEVVEYGDATELAADVRFGRPSRVR
ncbi:MAG: hypothetical protein GEV06_06410 [Luteitalea sp.]|nr:hypothetical protein [Luteitalea sp.]